MLITYPRAHQAPCHSKTSGRPEHIRTANWIGIDDLDRKISYPEAPFLSRTQVPIQNPHHSRLERTSPDAGSSHTSRTQHQMTAGTSNRPYAPAAIHPPAGSASASPSGDAEEAGPAGPASFTTTSVNLGQRSVTPPTSPRSSKLPMASSLEMSSGAWATKSRASTV